MALYIALYENFSATFMDNVKGFLCRECIEDGKLQCIETSQYKEKIKNRIVDQKGNKDALKATMLWLQDKGAMSEEDYSDFLKIKSIRNTYAHEMPRLIIEGVPLEDIQWFLKLLDLYGKLDKWWINEIELPICGEFLPGTYDDTGVQNVVFAAFKSIISSLYLRKDESQTRIDGDKV